MGLNVRGADSAFLTLALDGVPWLTIERADDMVGTQQISTTVTGTGTLRRRGGTSVPFRYTCILDARNQAMMAHASHLMPQLGDELPPAIVIAGTARYLENLPLPRGIELRVQLLDIGGSPQDEVLTEQVVRSGWQQPIPFALRLPKTTSLQDRKLAIVARLVLAHETLFKLDGPRAVPLSDIDKPIELVLEQVSLPGR
jgi:uncharacterized lipoprotein YbaY